MARALDDIAIFVGVARTGSFVGAARSLSLPTSTVSRRVATLEARLKIQLLRRTTRAISLTEDGKAFAERCGAALGEIDAAEKALTDSGGALRGTFRVTAPFFICPTLFGNWLLDFAAAHPALKLDLRLTNAEPDLIEDSIDLAFQVGPLREQQHVARRLWQVGYTLCAARKLLDRYPALAEASHPRDLADFPCIVTPPVTSWRFERSGDQEFSFTPRSIGASSDDWTVGAAAVKRGMGIGYLPDALVQDALGNEMVAIELGGWRPPARELFALYPASRHLSPNIRAAVDYALQARAVHG